MSTHRKSSIAKRQRELDQKDRVKEREARRAERKVRAEARAASGLIGPEIEELPPPGADDAPATDPPDLATPEVSGASPVAEPTPPS